MPYAQNLPHTPFPRGLGELAHRAGGFGTWVVDMHWGLSPPFITGQGRPYGPPVVQTFYPRSQAPRLQNLQTGPVVAAGTWPDLLQADASPVFRTPVTRTGEQQLSLPPGAGVAGLAGGYSGLHGYGHIPLGVARPPTEMYERASFGSRGTAGFGEEPAPGTLPDNLTILGTNYAITPEDWQQLIANRSGLLRTLHALYTIYAARVEQVDTYNVILATFGALYPDYYQRKAYAQQIAFGTPDGQARALAELDGLLKVREDLRSRTTPEQIAAMPTDVRRMYEQFVLEGAPSLPIGYGIAPALAAIYAWLPVALPWVLGGLAVLGAGAAAVGLYRWATGGAADDARAQAERDGAAAELASTQAYSNAMAKLSSVASQAKTEQERLTAMNAIQDITVAFANARQKKKALRSAGGGEWLPVVLGAGAIVGLMVFLRWLGRGASRRLQRSPRESSEAVSPERAAQAFLGIEGGR